MLSRFTIWVDVEDIFQYFDNNKRPSGIQRLVYEILRVLEPCAARRTDGPGVRLVRRDEQSLVHAVDRASLDALFEVAKRADTAPGVQASTLGSAAPAPSSLGALPLSATPEGGVKTAIIRRLEALPPEVGEPLIGAAVHQLRALRLLGQYARRRLRGGSARAAADPAPEAAPEAAREAALKSAPEAAPGYESAAATSLMAYPGGDFEADALPRPGDVYLMLGASWSEPDFGVRLQRLRERFGLQPVLLLYDLIPALRPEWCARSLVQDFRHWLATALPQCGYLLAISRATAESATAYAAREGLPLQAPIRAIPIGSGFGEHLTGGAPSLAVAAAPPPRGLPAPGSYVLFVSTLEARKNHLLLFHVWRRLVAERPLDDIPTLVFAGRVGWLVADLMQQLENTDWLRGRIRLIRDPSDDELAQLYDGCLFTLFPSLFEGWGLPVTESLMAGRPCIASNSTSIPEAGGPLTRYFDPENVDDAYAVILRTLSDRDDLQRWREAVARDFRPVPWERTADAVLDACLEAHRLAVTGPEAHSAVTHVAPSS